MHKKNIQGKVRAGTPPPHEKDDVGVTLSEEYEQAIASKIAQEVGVEEADVSKVLKSIIKGAAAHQSQESQAEGQPIIIDPKTGEQHDGRRSVPLKKRTEKRRIPIAEAPSVPVRVQRRQIAVPNNINGSVEYSTQMFVQWYNPDANEFQDVAIVNEEDDFEIVEVND